MLKSIYSLLLISMFSFSAVAQDESLKSTTVSPEPEKVMATKGIRVGIFKPVYKYKLRSDDVVVTQSDDEIKSDLGVNIGYVQMPIQNIGFAGLLSVIDLDNEAQMYRFEGSAGYAFNSYIYAYGGLSINKILGDDDAEEWDTGGGVQVGTGLQVTKNFGLDLRYVVMTQSYDTKSFGRDVEIDLIIRGVEMGLTATF